MAATSPNPNTSPAQQEQPQYLSATLPPTKSTATLSSTSHPTIQCQCQSLTVQFLTPSPLFLAESCKKDSFAKLLWSSQHGGPSIPPEVYYGERPVLLAHFSNSMIVKGKRYMRFMQMRGDVPMIDMVCGQCCTLMVSDHVVYLKNAVSFYPDVVSYKGPAFPKPIARWFANDWDEESLSKLDPLPGFYADRNTGEMKGTGKGWARGLANALGKFRDVKLPRRRDGRLEGVTFDELLKWSGTHVKVFSIQPESPKRKKETVDVDKHDGDGGGHDGGHDGDHDGDHDGGHT